MSVPLELLVRVFVNLFEIEVKYSIVIMEPSSKVNNVDIVTSIGGSTEMPQNKFRIPVIISNMVNMALNGFTKKYKPRFVISQITNMDQYIKSLDGIEAPKPAHDKTLNSSSEKLA